MTRRRFLAVPLARPRFWAARLLLVPLAPRFRRRAARTHRSAKEESPPLPPSPTRLPTPRRAPPIRPEVPAVPQIPPDGPLSRSDLIQLAIQAHPDFWRFRGEVAFFLEAEAAAYDWRTRNCASATAHEFEADLEGPYRGERAINPRSTVFRHRRPTSFVDNPGTGELSGIIRGSDLAEPAHVAEPPDPDRRR